MLDLFQQQHQLHPLKMDHFHHHPLALFQVPVLFYLHFESLILIQLLCSSFYAYINFNEINISIISGLIIFVLLNLILIVGYEIREKIENVEGIFESYEPQLIINILFNFIFLLLNGKCLYNAIVFKKDCK